MAKEGCQGRWGREGGGIREGGRKKKLQMLFTHLFFLRSPLNIVVFFRGHSPNSVTTDQ